MVEFESEESVSDSWRARISGKRKKPDSIGEEKKNLENPNPRFSSKREMQIFADKDRSQKPH
jgi:hypothetical protein